MATTSSIDLPTSATDSHRVDAPVWAFHVVVDQAMWAADVVRWLARDARIDFRVVHLVPAGIVGGLLLAAAYGLGLSA